MRNREIQTLRQTQRICTYLFIIKYLSQIKDAITDASGTKAEEIYYYPYGGTRQDTGNVNVKHKYTGQEEDPESGLYYYGARYYDPALARFISADTIVPEPEDPQSLNRYSYVKNNPLIYIDPTGNEYEERYQGDYSSWDYSLTGSYENNNNWNYNLSGGGNNWWSYNTGVGSSSYGSWGSSSAVQQNSPQSFSNAQMTQGYNSSAANSSGFSPYIIEYLPDWIPTFDKTYDRWVVTTKWGIPINVSKGSINPDPKQDGCIGKECTSIASRVYPFKSDMFPYDPDRPKKRPALYIDMEKVPTRGSNPNQKDQNFGTGAWIHDGCKEDRTCSTLCLTVRPKDWQGFMKPFPRNTRGKVVVW